MSADELSDFIAARPSGAMCVVDDDGRLLAVPARIVDETGGTLSVEVTSPDLVFMLDHRTGCVVADTFESYDSIRGVIVRGPARSDLATPNLVELNVVQMTTFSFADDQPD
jgi:hypothetical protein